MGEREAHGADALFGPDGTSGDGVADAQPDGVGPLPGFELPVVQLPTIGPDGQVTGLAGAEDLDVAVTDGAMGEPAAGAVSAGQAESDEAPAVLTAGPAPSAASDVAAPARAPIIGTVAPPAPAGAPGASEQDVPVHPVGVSDTSEPAAPAGPDAPPAPAGAPDGSESAVRPRPDAVAVRGKADPVGSSRRPPVGAPQRPGPPIGRPRPAGRPGQPTIRPPSGPPVSRPVTTAPGGLQYRPPIEPEPSILGLSRHARGRAGSRAFTLVFVGIFAVILIQLIVELLNP
ncbi:hypothetical protein [Pseudonocardia sp. H11422]|uniref:hypothetical protein n=1 Tax=Pseudonocardia sp. H11422 TaxID=2835866 RepID=UPI001BDCBC8A|nr:hypothetical protein [Pseudonocardia sp. H11422]